MAHKQRASTALDNGTIIPVSTMKMQKSQRSFAISSKKVYARGRNVLDRNSTSVQAKTSKIVDRGKVSIKNLFMAPMRLQAPRLIPKHMTQPASPLAVQDRESDIGEGSLVSTAFLAGNPSSIGVVNLQNTLAQVSAGSMISPVLDYWSQPLSPGM